ncbi:peptidase inhibitor family I36 protein [Streptomyces sp. NPDC007100]|uniref:peptidase inhibitor family I36 protein n=1 Tax=unclassified Streptomyces TaxID=2593676 RepID=UPI0033C04D47
MKRISKLAAAALGAALLVPAVATTAQAGSIHGCPDSSFCFYYNSNMQGSHDSLRAPDNYGDLAGYKFTSSGKGQGMSVKNNAASVVNNTSCTARVYVNSGYSGAYDAYMNLQRGNLDVTYNNNASLYYRDGECG